MQIDKVIYPGLAALFTALLFWAWGLIKGAPNSVIIPSGAVVAFNLSSCPSGWSDFSPAHGRTVVGVGRGEGLSNRALLELGGAENHKLTIPEMPSHAHTGNVSIGDGYSFEHHQSNNRLPGHKWEKQSGKTGGNQPHNNMQPYVALRYCQKG